MSDVVIVGVIVAVSSTMSPLLLSWLNNRNRQQERMEDFARQDAIAEKTATAARVLATNTQKVVESTRETNSKLDVIHTLVNSNMTAAMKSELDATMRELAMMKEVVELKRSAGHEPSIETLATIEATQKKISELKSVLHDRELG